MTTILHFSSRKISENKKNILQQPALKGYLLEAAKHKNDDSSKFCCNSFRQNKTVLHFSDLDTKKRRLFYVLET